LFSEKLSIITYLANRIQLLTQKLYISIPLFIAASSSFGLGIALTIQVAHISEYDLHLLVFSEIKIVSLFAGLPSLPKPFLLPLLGLSYNSQWISC
jgi:hypothetical protein